MSRTVAQARSKLALTARYHSDDESRVVAAKRDLKEAVLTEKIREAIESAPELSPAQIARIAALLRPIDGQAAA